MNEFDLIALIREHLPSQRNDSLLAIGDDGAVLNPGQPVVAVTDTLVADVHFFPDVAAFDLGWKSLAVNLSDLAAMGAEPAWALLNLTLPGDLTSPPEEFVRDFMRGFAALAKQYPLDLVGGDTTRGPLSVTVTALGLQAGEPLTRCGARAGDLIVVSGTLGDAAWACDALYSQGHVPDVLAQRLHRPQPRIALGRHLPTVARCGLDISDGLLADLGHLLATGPAALGADIQLAQLPTSTPLMAAVSDAVQRWPFQLNGGDDYELLFLLPPERRQQLVSLAEVGQVPLTIIGEISAQAGIRCHRPDGGLFETTRHGYQHFT